MSGDYDELEILCNRYAARFGANLSAVPNMTMLKTNDYWIQMTMEQLEFEVLSGNLFATHKIKSLKIMNNLKLKVIQPETLSSVRETLEELVVLGNQALEKFPYEVLAVLSNLKLLSLQFTKNYTRWKSPIFPHVTSLETVNLIGNGFGRYLKGLGHLKNLKQLNLAEMNVGGRKYIDRRFQFLVKLPKLTSLALEKINLTLLPTYLDKMKQLKHLFLKNNKLVINKNWPESTELPSNLEILDLRWNNYESFPCKVFNLTHLNNLKTDMEILCFTCEDDKKKIDQLKLSCSQNSGSIKRKYFDPINNINSITDDEFDNDASGWTDDKSNEYEDELIAIVQTTSSFATQRPKMSHTVYMSTAASKVRNFTSAPKNFTSAPKNFTSSPKNFTSSPSSSITRHSSSPISNFRSSTRTTPSTTMMITKRKILKTTTTTTTTVTPKIKSTTTTLRTDYFYEDAPDWRSEHLINPRSKNDV